MVDLGRLHLAAPRLLGVVHRSQRRRPAAQTMSGRLILLGFAALLLNLAHIACVARRP